MSRRSQRLGDMVAGTLVVREREVEAPMWNESTSRTLTAAALAQIRLSLRPTCAWRCPRLLWPNFPLRSRSSRGLFSRRLDMDLTTRALSPTALPRPCAPSPTHHPSEISVETFLESRRPPVPRTGPHELKQFAPRRPRVCSAGLQTGCAGRVHVGRMCAPPFRQSLASRAVSTLPRRANPHLKALSRV